MKALYKKKSPVARGTYFDAYPLVADTQGNEH